MALVSSNIANTITMSIAVRTRKTWPIQERSLSQFAGVVLTALVLTAPVRSYSTTNILTERSLQSPAAGMLPLQKLCS